MKLPRWLVYGVAVLLLLGAWGWVRSFGSVGEAREAEARWEVAREEAREAERARLIANAALAEARRQFDQDTARLARERRDAEREAEEARRDRERHAAVSDSTLLSLERAVRPELVPVVRKVRTSHALERNAWEAERTQLIRLREIAEDERDTERVLRVETENTLAETERTLAAERLRCEACEEAMGKWKDAATAGIFPDPFGKLGKVAGCAAKLGAGGLLSFGAEKLEPGAGKFVGAGYGAAMLAGGC